MNMRLTIEGQHSPEIDSIKAAFLASVQMDDEADYLRRGRRFERYPSDRLGAVWVTGFRAAVAQEPGEASEASDGFRDADAEFRLRGELPPCHLAEAEFAELEAQIAANPVPQWMLEKIAAFTRSMENPSG